MKNNTERTIEAAVQAAIGAAISVIAKDIIVKQYDAYHGAHKPLPPKRWWESKTHYNKRVGK